MSRKIVFLFLFFLCFLHATTEADNFSLSDTTKHFKSNKIIIGRIESCGNKRTKEKIILRELIFHANDTIRADKLDEIIKESRQNLLNTSLFNFVTISYEIRDSIFADVSISVLERWYIWPVPVAELVFRNFNSWLQTGDFERINYGFFLKDNNFRGRKESLYLLLRFGYDELYSLSYQIPYINRKQTLGIGFNVGYIRNKEIAYNTVDNKLLYVDEHPQIKYNASIQLLFRPNIYNTHFAELYYNHFFLNDTLNKLNSDFSRGVKSPEFLTFHYRFKNDLRDDKPYPLNGHYFDIDFYKSGLMFETKNPNIIFLHSSYSKYFKLSEKFYAASGIIGGFASKREQPYYLSTGIGFGHDNIRGFDYYVINGQHYGIGKLNLKYVLLSPHIYTVKFIPSEKFSKIHYAFYVNLFADGGYAYDDNYYKGNFLANQFLYSSGVGLDFVTYYDKVLRLEFTINKLKETGLFINFIAPI